MDGPEALQRAGLLLALARHDGVTEALRLRVQVEAGQPVLDRLGAHSAAEVPAEPVPHIAVQHFVTLEVLDLQVLEPAPDLIEAVDLLARAVPDLLAFPAAALPHLPLRVALAPPGPGPAP